MRIRWFSNSSEHVHSRNQFFLLLALIWFTRLLFAFVIWYFKGPSGFFEADSNYYVQLAQNMLHGSFTSAGLPEIFRTPGYPLLLIPAVAFHHPVMIALTENFLLCTASAWLIWRIAGDLFPDPAAGFWASLLYCFEPIGLLFSEKLMTETLFTTLLLVFFWMLLRGLRGPAYRNLALAALVLGCATYVRPVTTYLSLAFVPLLLIFPSGLSGIKRACRALPFVVIFALSLAPWIIRNAVAADYAGFSSTGDTDLYFYCAAGVQAQLEHKNLVQEQNELGYNSEQQYFGLHPEQRSWSPGQSARFFRSEGKRLLSHHLLTYAGLHGRGCVTVVFDPGITDLLKVVRLYPESGGLLSRTLNVGFMRATLWLIREHPISAVLLPLLEAILVGYYALAIAGLRRLPFDMAFAFMTVVLYFVLVSGLPGAVARFRVPMMPLVCISAGVAIAYWKTKKVYAN